MTTCGDGLVQGLEECDDGALIDGDGCDSSCEIETFYNCTGEPSTCDTIIKYVSIRRFQVSNISPAGLIYDPSRRSFAGHKSQSSQNALELCLDGTVIDPGDGDCTNGCIILPDGVTKQNLSPTYEEPIRPVTAGTLVGAAYDPFTGTFLYLTSQGSTDRLTQVFPNFAAPQVVGDFDVVLTGLGNPAGMTVGEDGDLLCCRRRRTGR